MEILGVRLDNVNMEQALQKIQGFLADGRQHYIVTPNPDFIVLAQKDKEFREILNQSDLSVPDGFGLILASWYLGERLKERVAGVELIEKLKNQTIVASAAALERGGAKQPHVFADDYRIAASRLASGLAMSGVKIFLLGGFKGAAESIAKNWPAVAGFTENLDEAVNLINRCQPDILLVALGPPKQEKWIAQNLAKIPSVKVAIGVGSAFNILSGQIKRAPRIFQALGLEWLWRLFLEPRRWRKVWRSVTIFPFLVLKSKLKNV